MEVPDTASPFRDDGSPFFTPYPLLLPSPSFLPYNVRLIFFCRGGFIGPGPSRYSQVITVSNLTMQFGEKPLFEDVSVKFKPGNRYGLIGANGSGKSTFLRIVSGEQEASMGSVHIDEHARLGILRQDQFAYEEHSVIDTVIMGHARLYEIKKERERLYGLPEMSEEEGILAGELEMEFGNLDGYMAEAQAGELLEGVGIPTAMHFGPMSAVAPGLKLRVLLAQALFGNPDILLLDEPTNNLDIDTIRWLEEVLVARDCLMIIISHDRHFLNSVCTHMADLDYGELRMFPGNYDEYMTAATQARDRLQAENAKKKAKIAELQAFVSRFSANASKARQATSRQRQLDKIELHEIKPSSRVNPYIRFEQDKELHRLALTVENLSQGFDDLKLIDDASFTLEAGERVAIIGANGAGKTTLVRTLMGELEPVAGSVKWAENVTTGYYAQDHAAEFESDTSLLDWMENHRPEGADEQAVRATLGQMLFSKDAIKKPVNRISGGEQGRMIFGRIMLKKPNVIVMDEPTNHLDMESIESLNLALEHYPGTLIFVSHDRQFVSSLATRIFDIRPDGLVDFRGCYEDYLRSRGIDPEARRVA